MIPSVNVARTMLRIIGRKHLRPMINSSSFEDAEEMVECYIEDNPRVRKWMNTAGYDITSYVYKLKYE